MCKDTPTKTRTTILIESLHNCKHIYTRDNIITPETRRFFRCTDMINSARVVKSEGKSEDPVLDKVGWRRTICSDNFSTISTSMCWVCVWSVNWLGKTSFLKTSIPFTAQVLWNAHWNMQSWWYFVVANTFCCLCKHDFPSSLFQVIANTFIRHTRLKNFTQHACVNVSFCLALYVCVCKFKVIASDLNDVESFRNKSSY